MKIAQNTVVSISYTLKNGGEEGDVLEMVTNEQPFTFLFGAGNLLPLFEKELADLEVGNDFKFLIKSEDGYGTRNPEAVIDLDIKVFEINGKLAEEFLVPGSVVPLQDQDGNPLNGTVKEVKEDKVIVDLNHPMAGIDLHFTGSVINVREANQDEISQGQVSAEEEEEAQQ